MPDNLVPESPDEGRFILYRCYHDHSAYDFPGSLLFGVVLKKSVLKGIRCPVCSRLDEVAFAPREVDTPLGLGEADTTPKKKDKENKRKKEKENEKDD